MRHDVSRLHAMASEVQMKTNHHQNRYHYLDSDNGTIIYGFPHNKIYIPSDTAKLFHADDTFVRLVMGPYNSGKTTMCLQEIVRRTRSMPAWRNGRRAARWAIVRNTVGELYSTTLKSWLNWFADLGTIHKRQKPILTYEHQFNDGDGIIDLELLFIALDREEDLRKIKSLEVTGCYINELSEVPEATLAHFKGRVNHRYPSRSFCSDGYWSGIIADTNPPDVDHWIYGAFENGSNLNYKIFRQPTGLIKDEDKKWVMNKSCDNYVNMAPDYYTKLAEGQSEDFVKVYCLGEYGLVSHGKAVYPEYRDDFHSVDDIPAIQGLPIHVFWDFGLTPSCLVLQLTPSGALRALKEYTADNMGIKNFAESIVLPRIKQDFVYNKIGISLADPSGIKKDEIMEELSCIGILNQIGIETHAARTNSLAPRLSSVRFFLNLFIDGTPGFLLSRRGCPILRKGFIRDYCYKRIAIAGEERYRDEPDKKHPVSDVHDCLQYGAMEFAASSIVEEKTSKVKVDMFNPIPRIY